MRSALACVLVLVVLVLFALLLANKTTDWSHSSVPVSVHDAPPGGVVLKREDLLVLDVVPAGAGVSSHEVLPPTQWRWEEREKALAALAEAEKLLEQLRKAQNAQGAFIPQPIPGNKP
jgi:hypothetical protein